MNPVCKNNNKGAKRERKFGAYLGAMISVVRTTASLEALLQ